MFIVAHRGASAYAPENTLKAFELAERLNASAIEFDVRLSKDGIPVVMHDLFLNRVSGKKGKVDSRNFEQLKKLRVGSERIPSLNEVLTATSLPLFVEVKEIAAIGPTLKLLANFKKRVVIVSFFEEVLLTAKKLGFKIAIVSFAGLTAVKRIKHLQPDYVLAFKVLLGRDLIKFCKRNKVKVLAWVVNDKREALRFKALGVDGIVTDKPDILLD